MTIAESAQTSDDPFRRLSADDRDRVTGRTRFTADIHAPGALEAAFVSSTVPFARIRSVDTAAARELPGVMAVLTGADIGRILTGRAIHDYPLLAVDRVAFLGQRIAAVAAVDRATAMAAATLVEVDYEPLEPIFDVDAAYSAPSPVIHPDYTTYDGAVPDLPVPNAQGGATSIDGDAAAALAECDEIHEHLFFTSRNHSAPLEPHACLVDANDSEVHVYSTNKTPYSLRRYMHEMTGRPQEEIFVHPVNIGGDFGSKGYSFVDGACYYLSMATGRPVRSVMPYYEELTATCVRHPATFRLRSGVKAGRLHGHESQTLLDGGAFAGVKAVPRGIVSILDIAMGPYDVPDRNESLVTVYTNTAPGGHVRSPGEFQMCFAGESHVDMIARARGEDPIEFRLRNVRNPQVTEILHRLRDVERDWRSTIGPDTGIGVSLVQRAAGSGTSTVSCRATVGGGVEFVVGVPDQGAGSYNVIRRLASRVLGVTPERIGIRYVGAEASLIDSGAGASRVTAVAGRAGLLAAEALLAELGGSVGTGDDWIDERMRELGRDTIEVTGTWNAPRPTPGQERPHSHAGLAVEVGVERETGVVSVRHALMVVDGGEVVNPVGHTGQIEGGFVYGLGQTLYEDLATEDGQVMTVSLGDYKLACAADAPPLQISLIEPDPSDGEFFGIRAIGELANLGVAPAVANAIDDAIGVRINRLPITAERVWRTLHGRGEDDTGPPF